MRFLVDECTGPNAAAWLRGRGYEVFSAYEQSRGADDDVLLEKAFLEDWILITNDKDFGERSIGNAVRIAGLFFFALMTSGRQTRYGFWRGCCHGTPSS